MMVLEGLRDEGLRDRYIGSLFRVDEPVPDDSWDEGVINEEVIEKWAHEHMRTPYRPKM